MTKKDPEQIIPIVLEMVYPIPWLDSKTDDGKTNREAQVEVRQNPDCHVIVHSPSVAADLPPTDSRDPSADAHGPHFTNERGNDPPCHARAPAHHLTQRTQSAHRHRRQ